ncbi:MAG TPA: type II secretion system F family protein [Actinomycetales bacterium]|nr:type II secretion system F family protein [Actinomycetales bacterium]
MSAAVLGGLLGLGAVSGVLLMLTRLPALRRPTLEERLVPYLPTTAGGWDRHRGRSSGGPLRALSTRFGEALGSPDSIRRRLERAGRLPDVEAFRAEQLLWAAAGLLVAGAVAAGLWWRGAASVGPLVALVLLAGTGGFASRDWLLGRQASRREDRMLGEFPTIADLLALSVAAGEGPAAAIERVVRISSGELASELRTVLGDVRAGSPLVEALGRLAARTRLVPLARFVDGVVVAVERGTPLAGVLKAQAEDVREARRRALVESAGRKEIAMMVPVVFLVLPVTVLFAVYPGFAFLRLSL